MSPFPPAYGKNKLDLVNSYLNKEGESLTSLDDQILTFEV